MASLKFNVYRYRYQSDSGDEFIREQRVQVNPDNNSEILPVTGIFLNAVVSLPDSQKKIKAEKFNNKERLTEVTYINLKGDISTTNRYIPYNDSINIRNQLKEQQQFSNVVCLSYKGETRNYQLNRFI